MKTLFPLLLIFVVLQIKSQTVTTVCGKTSPGSLDGSLGTALFNGPNGVTLDSKGYLYVADYITHLIRKIDLSAGTVTTIAGSGVGFANGVGVASKFNMPINLATDSVRNLYIADFTNNMIRKIDTLGNVTTFAGSGASGSSDGLSSMASFLHPSAVSFKNGNCYVTDFDNSKIRKISGGTVTTVSGMSGVGYVNGTIALAKFDHVYGLTLDKIGNIIICDRNNHKIRKIDLLGNVTTIAGSSAGFLDGPASTAKFNNPTGVIVDTMNNIFVADFFNHKIRKIDPLGNVTTIAGAGAGFKDSVGTYALFNYPASIAFNKTQNIIYVADYSNNRIRKILLHAIDESGNGDISTGNGGSGSNTGAGIGLGVEEITNLNELVVHPNPATGILYINNKVKANEIEIKNALGSVVYKSNSNNNDVNEIDIKHLSEGIYFLKISINSNSKIIKFIKTN